MKRILVTGFEPFGNKKTNITQEVIDSLPHAESVRTEILPVEFSRAAERALALAEDADAILLLGEQPSVRAGLRFEQRAHNRAYAGAIADNAGKRKWWSRIDPDGPKRLASTMTYDELIEALDSASIDVRQQKKIGRFVCNDIFYRTLLAQQRGEIDSSTKVGFMHIGSRTDRGHAVDTVSSIIDTLQRDDRT